MSVGKQVLNTRKEQNLTQDEFGKLFHVTRQTVSSWENEKSYPDLQTLVAMSETFGITLDKLLKEDSKMLQAIDSDRLYAAYVKREKSFIDFFTGTGTGMVISCLISPHSIRRTVVICIGIAMIGIGWYKKAKYDKAIIKYLENQKSD